MKKFSKVFGFILVIMAMMATMCTVSFAAEVGQKLKSPESGWQRIDDTDSKIKYKGTWLNYTYPEFWEGTQKYSLVTGSTINFKFYGTKLRIIGQYFNQASNNTQISIDSVVNNYSEYLNTTSSSFNKYLVFEKSGLELGLHSVEITLANTGTTRFDAIDIDDTGYLIDFEQSTNLTATASNAKVDLVWDSVPNATSYNVKRAITSGGEYTTIATVNVTSGAITSYVDNTAKNGTPYFYVVTVVNASGESSNSNEVSATPQATNQLKLVLEVNEDKQLSISNELFDNTEMDWISSDSSIATVDQNGTVKALKSGNTVITCTSKDKSYTESINVLVVDLEYQLAVDLTVGDKCRLTVDDLENTTNVMWNTYDSTIATITTKGKVTAISDGLTYIFASDKDGKEIGRIYIRVSK